VRHGDTINIFELGFGALEILFAAMIQFVAESWLNGRVFANRRKRYFSLCHNFHGCAIKYFGHCRVNDEKARDALAFNIAV